MQRRCRLTCSTACRGSSCFDVSDWHAVSWAHPKLGCMHRIDAVPGSGKTRVLIARIAHLILERGVPADEIMAITFTRKAARQLQLRLAATLGEKIASNIAAGAHSCSYEQYQAWLCISISTCDNSNRSLVKGPYCQTQYNEYAETSYAGIFGASCVLFPGTFASIASGCSISQTCKAHESDDFSQLPHGDCSGTRHLSIMHCC